ncbi:enoyl-CoA hydratase-related protein [Microbacterium sp.]|uniref:enoyl-CoA hydratase/isomerase family protein n=1 Tax=Microbacterium sp. TaxID=51671 RepID=UPI0025DDE187|nr:enoyl-CoA hydratase-related protein [Microbacterium sp.]
MGDSILLSVDGGLARVTFNRPASLNAVDRDMGMRWREIAYELTSDASVGAVILDAAGPAFCAGGDVLAMGTAGETDGGLARSAEILHEGIHTFVLSDKPIVAAVQGAVAGGGLGLMLTADYIVASDAAKFVSRYANVGLTPDLGASTLLPAAIGQRRALQLLLQDLTLDAATALEWGLVAEVVAPGALAARAEAVARFWLENSTVAYGQAKRLVRVGAGRSFSENLADEARTIGARSNAPDAKERIAAFAAASRKRT